MNAPAIVTKPKPADYASDQQVRWCPGCGDYAILKGIQRTLADLQLPKERLVLVSGIGCASRLPYYLDTYGFHTIHGRAPAFATGIKLTNPELDVWIITGDGDGLSIGGNQLLHLLRRNPNVQILLFNNEIYGLTKGQYSPTSRFGTVSPSTPFGSIDTPVEPARFALGSGARFVARVVDTDQARMPQILKQAHAHPGAAFVELFQNCIVYNDKVFADFADKAKAAERQLFAEHGKPLKFGRNADKGLRLKPDGLALEVVELGREGIDEDAILVHDATNRALAGMLAELKGPDFPVITGVLYDAPAQRYDTSLHGRRSSRRSLRSAADLNALMREGDTWTTAP
jgi:2-oxoglutarate ferredoxin oxidoreductase subunit beta